MNQFHFISGNWLINRSLAKLGITEERDMLCITEERNMLSETRRSIFQTHNDPKVQKPEGSEMLAKH